MAAREFPQIRTMSIVGRLVMSKRPPTHHAAGEHFVLLQQAYDLTGARVGAVRERQQLHRYAGQRRRTVRRILEDRDQPLPQGCRDQRFTHPLEPSTPGASTAQLENRRRAALGPLGPAARHAWLGRRRFVGPGVHDLTRRGDPAWRSCGRGDLSLGPRIHEEFDDGRRPPARLDAWKHGGRGARRLDGARQHGTRWAKPRSGHRAERGHGRSRGRRRLTPRLDDQALLRERHAAHQRGRDERSDEEGTPHGAVQYSPNYSAQ